MSIAFAWIVAPWIIGLAPAAADRTPQEIVAAYDAVPSPASGREKLKDPKEIQAYRKAAVEASRARGALALELLNAAPDHERLPEMLIQRWVDTMMARDTAAATTAEIDRAIPPFKAASRRKTARQMRAIATVQSHPDDPEAALPEIERFLTDFPGDPMSASLLNGFASTTRDPGLKRKLLARLVAEFPDSPASRSAASALAVLDRVGKPLDLEFEDAISKKPVSLKALKGKVVVLDFWATWCGPCVADMPNMKKLYEEYKDRGVAFLGVNLDDGDDGRKKLESFVERNALPWPQHYDGKAWDSPLVDLLGVRAIPTVVVVDRNGDLAELDAHGRLAEVLPRLLADAAKP